MRAQVGSRGMTLGQSLRYPCIKQIYHLNKPHFWTRYIRIEQRVSNCCAWPCICKSLSQFIHGEVHSRWQHCPRVVPGAPYLPPMQYYTTLRPEHVLVASHEQPTAQEDAHVLPPHDARRAGPLIGWRLSPLNPAASYFQCRDLAAQR